MSETVFDFSGWLLWKEILQWTINGIGAITCIAAYVYYNPRSQRETAIFSLLLLFICAILLGFFPIEWGYSTDRANYGNVFLQLKQGGEDPRVNDPGFTLISRLLATFLNAKEYFFALTLLCLGNYFFTVRRLAGAASFWLLMGVVLSFGFTSYCINTIRAGLALSFIILAIGLYPSRWKMAIAAFIGISIHTSVIIPAIMMLISLVKDRTKLYYVLWLMAIPLSYASGSVFANIFANMSEDARTSYLTSVGTSNYNIGFRFDFILYSLTPIAIGAFYIFRRGFQDRLYKLMYNTYILTNIFWILVIRANYSDRFAYLSWVFIPFVLIYPLMKNVNQTNTNKWLALILLGELIFRNIF